MRVEDFNQSVKAIVKPPFKFKQNGGWRSLFYKNLKITEWTRYDAADETQLEYVEFAIWAYEKLISLGFKKSKFTHYYTLDSLWIRLGICSINTCFSFYSTLCSLEERKLIFHQAVSEIEEFRDGVSRINHELNLDLKLELSYDFFSQNRVVVKSEKLKTTVILYSNWLKIVENEEERSNCVKLSESYSDRLQSLRRIFQLLLSDRADLLYDLGDLR